MMSHFRCHIVLRLLKIRKYEEKGIELLDINFTQRMYFSLLSIYVKATSREVAG